MPPPVTPPEAESMRTLSVTGPDISPPHVPLLSLQSMAGSVAVVVTDPPAASMRTMSENGVPTGGPDWNEMLTTLLAVPGTVQVSTSWLGVHPDHVFTLHPAAGWSLSV